MPVKKKLKTRISSKRESELIRSVVRAMNREKTVPKPKVSNTVGTSAADVDDLRRDMQRMQETFGDRLSRMEDKLNSLRMFADETRRVVAEQGKNLDIRLDQMAMSVNESLAKEERRNLKLVKSVYKEHGEEFTSLRESMRGLQEESRQREQLMETDIQFLVKDISKIKECVDELTIKRLGYIPQSKTDQSRSLDTNVGLTMERMNQKMKIIEQRLGDANVSPSRNRETPRKTVVTAFEQPTDKLVGKLLLRVEDCERQIERIKSHPNGDRVGGVSPLDLKADIKTLGKNTSKACRALSAGLEDVQQATLLLYDWADKVHNSFETISYKLEFPTNICPRAQVNMRRNNIPYDV